MKRILVALALLLSPLAAHAQNFGAVVVPACGTPNNAPVVGSPYSLTQDPTLRLCDSGPSNNTANSPYYIVGKQESFALVTNNVASGAVTVTGGDYVLSQVCSGYGTLVLQGLDASGAYENLISKTATDSVGGTGVTLAGNAVVRVLLTGTTGCVATLTRVP
jgi:hypothetical protein